MIERSMKGDAKEASAAGMLLGKSAQEPHRGESHGMCADVVAHEWLLKLIDELSEEQLFELLGILGRLTAMEPSEATLKVLDGMVETFGLGIAEVGESTFEERLLDARCDYVRLMVGEGEPLAPPWESVWVNSERSLFQKCTLDVRRRYAAAGVEVANKYHEPDDHIGYEMEFISMRCAGGEDGKSIAASFFADHLGTYAFDWCDAVFRHGRTPYYRVLASVIACVLRRVQQVLREE